MSVPAETELAAMFVPNWASAKAAEMKKTPARFLDPPSSRNCWRRTNGSHIGSFLKITVDEEDTIMPMKEVIANPIGMVNSWDHSASFGLRAKRAKSGSFTMRVAKLAMADIIPVTTPQASLEPVAVFPCLTIGPIPLALTSAQMKNEIPAVGTTYAFTVKRCRILWTGNQIAGSETNQKMKNDTNSTVLVPEPGIPLWILLTSQAVQMEEIMSFMHFPPMNACTPYQIQAMAALLNTGHNAPQMPKDARETTGKEM